MQAVSLVFPMGRIKPITEQSWVIYLEQPVEETTRICFERAIPSSLSN